MSNKPAETPFPFDAEHAPGTWATNNRSFLVRIWREAEDGPWRASITNVHSKESRTFGTIQALFLHLHEQIANSTKGEESGT